MKDQYYIRPEVSNSDMTSLKKYFQPDFIDYDPTEAYRFGNLVDFMITEPEKVDYLNYTIDCYEEPFQPEQFEKARKIRIALNDDEYWNKLAGLTPNFQRIFSRSIQIVYGKLIFSINARCKFDFFFDMLGWGGDIKTTTATTQKQFEDAFWHFDYPRSRAWYMDLSGADKDVVIGISKENFKVFKIFITRDTEYYKQGKEQYQELAFQWWKLFENFKINA